MSLPVPKPARRVRHGLTLVELLIGLALLAVLIAAGLPRLFGADRASPEMAVRGVAGAAASAMAINFAACAGTLHRRTGPGAEGCRLVDSCADVKATMRDGWPEGFELIDDAAIGPGGVNGVEATCSVRLSARPEVSASFIGISAGQP